MNARSRMLPPVVGLVLVVHLGACAAGGGAGDSASDRRGADPLAGARYVAGQETILITKTIGAAGGVIEVAGMSPMGAVTVTIPAGALSGDTRISVGYDDGRIENAAGGVAAGPTLVLHSDGQTEFPLPVSLTIPDPRPETSPVVLLHADDSGKLELVTIQNGDPAAGTATFATSHFSRFPRLLVDDDDAEDLDSGFRPETNGLRVSNANGFPPYQPGGACHGMAAFALWYFSSHGQASPLFDRYTDAVPTVFAGMDEFTGPKPGQALVAVRAQAALEEDLARSIGDHRSRSAGPWMIRRVMKGLRWVGPGAYPVVLYLADAAGAHAVLAYGTRLGDFLVYDPNRPGEESRLAVTLDGAVLSHDTGRSRFWPTVGYVGALRPTESFEFIDSEARAGFHGENLTKLEVTSHHSGQKVSADSATLTVKLGRGQVDISEVEVTSPDPDAPGGSSKQRIAIAEEQTAFDVKVKLRSGSNVILFTTRGKPTFGAAPEDIPNTLQGDTEERTFVLKREVTPVIVKYSCILETAAFTSCGAGYDVFDESDQDGIAQFTALAASGGFYCANAGWSSSLGWAACADLEHRCSYPVEIGASRGRSAYSAFSGAPEVVIPVFQPECESGGGTWDGPVTTDQEIVAYFTHLWNDGP